MNSGDNEAPPPSNNDRNTQPSRSAPSPQQQAPGNSESISFLRPPPFPYMAFNIPPPMPPTEGLSEEELRQLEQRTREGVEARLRCLQNIQCLLDASVVMMQQYSAAVAASQMYDNVYGGTEPRNTSTKRETSSADKNCEASEMTSPSSSSLATPPENPKVEVHSDVGENLPSTSVDIDFTKKEKCNETAEELGRPSCSTSTKSEESSEEKFSTLPTGDIDLRLKRVEKFTKTNSTTTN